MPCSKINDCPKITMVMDHDLPGDWFYAEEITAVCEKCAEKEMQKELLCQ